MNRELSAMLARWREAGVVDGPTASRIAAFEARGESSSGSIQICPSAGATSGCRSRCLHPA
jgi:hypothetical protein